MRALPPLDAALAERLAADPHRPRYHLIPAAHWMNDPNGLIRRRGEYHLFYQHNPVAATWGAMHWGRARRCDAPRWTPGPWTRSGDSLRDIVGG